MVKIKQQPWHDPTWGVAFAHVIPWDSPASPDWHLLYPFFGNVYDWWLFPLARIFTPDQPTAVLYARFLAAHAQITTDLCPYTHRSWIPGFHCPLAPRDNIYRDRRGEPLVHCVYWDPFRPDPPPGFQWAIP
jgi:hypothetical protein